MNELLTDDKALLALDLVMAGATPEEADSAARMLGTETPDGVTLDAEDILESFGSQEKEEEVLDLELVEIFDLRDWQESPYRVTFIREFWNRHPEQKGFNRCCRCGQHLRHVHIAEDQKGFHHHFGAECLPKALGNVSLERIALDTQRKELASRYEGLNELWEVWGGDHYKAKQLLGEFGMSIASKAWDKPSKFTERQASFIPKILLKVKEVQAKMEAPKLYKTGRQVVTGEVLSVRTEVYTRYRMRTETVKVLLNAGAYKVWTSVPSALAKKPVKGDMLTLKVTLKEGSTSDFAIGSRPALV